MLIRKAYKFKLKIDEVLVQKLAQMGGCTRLVWNKALTLNLERLAAKQKLMWYNELAFWLTFWKKTEELKFLKECHSQVLQQTLMHLERAFRDAFDKTQQNKKIPKFKRKFDGDSFCYPQGFKIDNRRIFLPKIGWVGFHKSREIEGKLKNITIKREADGWHVSIQVEMEIKDPIHTSQSCVGVDLGIHRFATLSTGEYFNSLNSLKKQLKKLAKLQKELKRKKKFSKGWHKQKAKIAKLHRKIRNCRLDYLHKVANKISKNHAVIFLEDLKVKNMSKSAKGSLDAPGKNVKAKSGLNRAMLDQGWGIFCNLLTYKEKWLGGEVNYVPPQYTSQKCPSCSHTDSRNRQTQSYFECTKCQYQNNADHVGALNVLAAGLAVMACESNSVRGRKQESVGNREEVLSLAN